jgi:hypothetical protein
MLFAHLKRILRLGRLRLRGPRRTRRVYTCGDRTESSQARKTRRATATVGCRMRDVGVRRVEGTSADDQQPPLPTETAAIKDSNRFQMPKSPNLTALVDDFCNKI